MKKYYLDWKNNKKGIPIREEIYTIYPMLRFLRLNKIQVDGNLSKKRNQYHYTCKHFIDDSCTFYELRPKMCSRFPYDSRELCPYTNEKIRKVIK